MVSCVFFFTTILWAAPPDTANTTTLRRVWQTEELLKETSVEQGIWQPYPAGLATFGAFPVMGAGKRLREQKRDPSVSVIINKMDTYITTIKKRLKNRRERLERWKTIPKAPEIIMQKDLELVAAAQKSLKEAEDFRKEFEGVTDFKSAMEIVRRRSVPPTSLQKEVLNVIKRVVPGFDKDIVLFTDKSSLLARAFNFEEKKISGCFISLGKEGNIGNALILIDKDREARLKLLSVLVHEHWHRKDNIKIESAMDRYLSEGITSYLQRASMKKILQGKSGVARLIKEEYEQNSTRETEGMERLSLAITKTDRYDPLIASTMRGYKNEREFVDMLFGSGMFSMGLGEKTLMKVYTTGDISPVKAFLGKRFDFISETAQYMENDVFQSFNRTIHRLMWAILVEPSFTEERFTAFKQGIAIFKGLIDEIYIEEDFDNPAEFNQRTRNIDFYAMIKKSADKFIASEIDSAEFETQLSEEIANKIMAAGAVNEALNKVSGMFTEEVIPSNEISVPRPAPQRVPEAVLEAI